MNEWQGWMGPLIDWLWMASVQATMIAALVIVVQWVFRGVLPARWSYLLWLLVVVRLLLPALPESPGILAPYLPPAPPPSSALFSRAPRVVMMMANPHAFPPAALAPGDVASIAEDIKQVACLTWIAGMAGLLVFLGIRNARFYRLVRQTSRPAEARVQEMAAAVAADLDWRREVPVVETAMVETPAVVGLFASRLLLPEGILPRLSEEDLRMVFRHEIAHLKRRDLAADFLCRLLQIVHWFNPLLGWAFAKMRHDRELATDALALAHCGNAGKAYGATLLKLVSEPSAPASCSPSIGILEDKRRLRQRIEQIARFKPRSLVWSALGLLLLALLALSLLTKKPAGFRSVNVISLLDLPVLDYHVGFGDLMISRSLDQRQVFLGQKECADYLFDHSPSRVLYNIPPGATLFTAVGVRPRGLDNIMGSWAYIVKIDGEERFHSKALSEYPDLECPIRVAIPPGAKQMELVTDDLRNSFCDHAVWAVPVFKGRFADKDIPTPKIPRNPIPLAP
jgi:beta-lactamase regulating signal transducer with metallopeptidase domain